MAKDYYHPIVKAALIQEGWDVTHDPLELKVGGVDMEIDLVLRHSLILGLAPSEKPAG